MRHADDRRVPWTWVVATVVLTLALGFSLTWGPGILLFVILLPLVGLAIVVTLAMILLKPVLQR